MNLADIRSGFQQLLNGTPEVSIVMPAYNEEAHILKALTCLSKSITLRSVEVIVVNNNSNDRTATLANASGVRCIMEPTQGITAARNAGLAAARGKYILNADADTLYPPDWIEEMIVPLEDDTVASVYGRFAFIPTTGTPRLVYFFYEYAADLMRWINKTFREEAMNVYGFNSGFRRNQGIQVEGFNHPSNASEDSWLALKLRKKGFGKLYYVTKKNALVWTMDRRIQIDGGLRKGLIKRIKRILTNNRKHR
jgi:glycosyltransferase involved in cell wall biosynthesis